MKCHPSVRKTGQYSLSCFQLSTVVWQVCSHGTRTCHIHKSSLCSGLRGYSGYVGIWYENMVLRSMFWDKLVFPQNKLQPLLLNQRFKKCWMNFCFFICANCCIAFHTLLILQKMTEEMHGSVSVMTQMTSDRLRSLMLGWTDITQHCTQWTSTNSVLKWCSS